MSPFDTPDDPFYEPKYVWEARGDLTPRDHTDWDIVETFVPRHRWPSYPDCLGLDTAWEHHPGWGPLYAAHTARHRSAS